MEINGTYPLLGKAGGIMNCNRSSTNIYRSCQLNNLNVVARQENKFLIYWPENSSITCNGTIEDSSENPILKEKEFLFNCQKTDERKDLSMMISSRINKIHNNNIGVMSIEGVSPFLEYYNYNDNETYNLACIYKEETLQMKIYPVILYLYSQIEENTTIDNEEEGEGGNGSDKDDEYLISTTISDDNKFNIPPPPIELPGSVAPTQSSSSSSSSSSLFIKRQQKIKQQQQQQQNNKRYLKEKLFENKIKSLSSIFNKPPPPTNYDFDINNRKLSENEENKKEETQPKLSKFEKYLKLVDGEIVSGDNAIFVTTQPILPEGQCFLLGNAKGENITIDKSDLMKYLRFQNNKYYFGPNSNPNSAFSRINNGTAIELIEESDIEIPDEEFRNKSGVIFPLSQLFSQDQFKSSLLQLTTGNKITMMFLSPINGIYMRIYTIVKVKFYNNDGIELDNEGNIINNKIIESRILQQSKRMNPNEMYVAIITNPPFIPIDEDTSFFFQIESNSIHEFIECSGAGLCNRNTGKCECFSGYEGIACQRLRCPNDCSNHGKCVTYDEAIQGSKYKYKIKQQFGYSGSNSLNEKFFGCLCENGYRGSDCSLKECPSFIDPQSDKDIKINKESRDCSGRGICNYDNGICECFDGYSGAGCEVIMPADY